MKFPRFVPRQAAKGSNSSFMATPHSRRHVLRGDEGNIGSHCAKGKHWNCYKVNCVCSCHKREEGATFDARSQK